MLTVDIVENKLKKALKNLQVDKINVKYKNLVSDNMEVDGKSVHFEISLDFNIETLLNNINDIYNKLIEDNITTLPILPNFKYSDNNILRGLKEYKSFLVNNSFYIFYRVYYTENIKTKVKLDKDCIEDTLKNDVINTDLIDISIEKITPEKINIELGVLYIKNLGE